jgi:quercetin dioxygenase-like cupin family protein
MNARPLVIALLLTSCHVPPAVVATPAGPKRTLLRREEVTGMPGWETMLYLVELPPGGAAPAHRHTVVGLGYVLEGTFESAFGDDAPMIRHEGESFVDGIEQVHTRFRNVSRERPLRFLMSYTLKKGELPLVPAPNATMP